LEHEELEPRSVDPEGKLERARSQQARCKVNGARQSAPEPWKCTVSCAGHNQAQADSAIALAVVLPGLVKDVSADGSVKPADKTSPKPQVIRSAHCLEPATGRWVNAGSVRPPLTLSLDRNRIARRSFFPFATTLAVRASLSCKLVSLSTFPRSPNSNDGLRSPLPLLKAATHWARIGSSAIRAFLLALQAPLMIASSSALG